MTTVYEVKAVRLRHPLHDVPAMAEMVDYWLENGRNIGLELQFSDGHRCHLTYAEIEYLQEIKETAVSDDGNREETAVHQEITP